MCSPGSLGPAYSLLGSWNVQLLWANEATHTQPAQQHTRAHTHAGTHARTHARIYSNMCPGMVKSIASIGSDFASLFVCVSPDCDTGVKRPIGGGQQVIVQPGTRESKWLETVLVL